MEGCPNYVDLSNNDVQLHDRRLKECSNNQLPNNSQETSLTSAEGGVMCSSTKNQHIMIRQVEQYRACQISFDKLNKIYGRDEYLCRWVVVQNIYKRLKQEIMNDIPHINNYKYYHSNKNLSVQNVGSQGNSYYCIKSENYLATKLDFADKSPKEANKLEAKIFGATENNEQTNLGSSIQCREGKTREIKTFGSTKRSFEDMDCDIEDNLSHLYATHTILNPKDNNEDRPIPKRMKNLTPSNDNDSLDCVDCVEPCIILTNLFRNLSI